jgi:predicted DNA-binding ribbon-helix-helix protein
MERSEVLEKAFFDELEKISASFKSMHVSKSRSGRRSMSVDTLLRKEKDGTLFKSQGPKENT